MDEAAVSWRAYSRHDYGLCFLRLWWPCERVSRHPRGGSPRRRSRHSRMHPRRCSRRKSAAARPVSAAADAADVRYSDGETWGSDDQSRWMDDETRDGKRGTPMDGCTTGYYLSPLVLAPTGLASRTSRHPRRAYTYYESSPLCACTTRRPLAFPLVRSEAAAWPKAFRLFSRTGFSAILEGADAINGRARGLARLATTFESTGHAASVLDLSCAIARPPCVKTGYCNSLLG